MILLSAVPQPRLTGQSPGTTEKGARVLAGLRSGDGLRSVRTRPSSIKRCARRDLHLGERLAGPFLEQLEVPDRVPMVLPLLLEDHMQALQHGVAASVGAILVSRHHITM